MKVTKGNIYNLDYEYVVHEQKQSTAVISCMLIKCS